LTDKTIVEMKKAIIIVCCVFGIIGCNNSSVEKPGNLIGKDKMVDILYDISLLEAIKAQNINGGLSSKASNEYIYKKYKIDSIQFVKSNRYYAANIEEYKKMYEQVKARLTKQTQEIESKMRKNGQEVPATSPLPTSPDVPQIQ
jgi:hypothetical protein